MIEIKAKISLYVDSGRSWPITTGYRPLFNIISETKISGHITILNDEKIDVGSSGDVNIRFVNDTILKDKLKVGNMFTFDEGMRPIGEAVVLEVLNNE